MGDLFVRMGLSPALVAALELELLGRLLVAALLGGSIGMERELRGKPSGLRTNLLICVGAALITALSIGFSTELGVVDGTAVRSDPARIAAQIVSGIGFIGAGTILHARGRVTGLTSAATLWVVAAIGMAVGAGSYVPAAGTALLVFVALAILGRLEDTLRRRRTRRRLALRLDANAGALERMEAEIGRAGLRVVNQSVEREGGTLRVRLDLMGPAPRLDEAARALAVTEGVRRVERER